MERPNTHEDVPPVADVSAVARPDDALTRRGASVAMRLARLERMAADPYIVARLCAEGRYLRLCAAIASASALVERTGKRVGVAAPPFTGLRLH